MRIAWLQLELGALEEACNAYSNAAHRYYLEDEMKDAAYALVDMAEISEKIGDNVGAAQSFTLATKRLEATEKNLSREEISVVRKIQAEWHRKAAYCYKKAGTSQEKRSAKEAFVAAAKRELSSGSPGFGDARDNYMEAIALAKEIGLHKELDQLQYELQTIKRKEATEARRYFFTVYSNVMDWLWGYGTKPWKLVRAIGLTMVVFGFFYAATQQVQIKASPLNPIKDRSLYTLLCMGYSVYTLFPTGILKWLTGIGLIVEFEVTDVVKWISAIEGVAGVIYLSMVTILIKRWLSRTMFLKEE